MSKNYKPQTANAVTKMESREKIAHSIRSAGSHSKVIHYLGGVREETPFENFFNISQNTFVRYEKELCETPQHYAEATWVNGGLVEKQPNQFGYFSNGNFYEEVYGFIEVFGDQKNYFWLDFCNMPKEEDLDSVYYTLFHEDSEVAHCVEEVYLTFFNNGRGMKFVSELLNRYGSSMDDRARSMCDGIRERFALDNFEFSVFDVYVNSEKGKKGCSPMAVIKIKRK